MTTLGLIFVGIYAVAIVGRGRDGLLIALACSVPFNDSIVIAVGNATVSPFYAGLIVYLLVSVFSSARSGTSMRRSAGLPLAMLFYATFITVLGPIWFKGTGVIASGAGDLNSVDPQITPLAFSISDLAQALYLALAVGLIIENERDRGIDRRFLAIAFSVGTFVALTSRAVGAWPHYLFDNSARNSYATNNARLRGQFSEPSHLGAFALTAFLFFLCCSFQAKGKWHLAGALTGTMVALFLIIDSASGTAIVGGAVALGLIVLVGGLRAIIQNSRISYSAMMLGLGVIVVLLLEAPRALSAIADLIDNKQGGVSYSYRSQQNNLAVHIFERTYLLGVGNGSNRASSLFLMLLSTIGIAGVLLFIALLVRCTARALGDRDLLPALLSLLGLVCAAFTSDADFASPVLWTLVAACNAGGRLTESNGAVRSEEPARLSNVTQAEDHTQPDSMATQRLGSSRGARRGDDVSMMR